jgi:anti-anti-sigma regulatory factor
MAKAEAIGEQLVAPSRPSAPVVIGEWSTTFCDDSGTNMLVLAWQQATGQGIELRLLLPNAGVLQVMQILGLDTFLCICHSPEEVLAPAARRRVGCMTLARSTVCQVRVREPNPGCHEGTRPACCASQVYKIGG